MNSRTAAAGIILGAVVVLALAAAVPRGSPAPIERRAMVSVEMLAQPDAPQTPLQEIVTTAARLPSR